jgi:hypothetical protein
MVALAPHKKCSARNDLREGRIKEFQGISELLVYKFLILVPGGSERKNSKIPESYLPFTFRTFKKRPLLVENNSGGGRRNKKAR